MEAAIVIMALLFVAFVALGVYATVKAVKAAKRGVDRTITHARRTVEDTTLRAKSFGQGGVAGELAQLRLSLRTSMRATQEALHAGVAEDASLKESLDLFRRLSAHGLELDEELKRLEREPDRSGVAAVLADIRERTERITHSADSLRWAARDRARKFADDDLASLSAQIDVEAGALRHWDRREDGRLAEAPGFSAAAGASGAAGAPAGVTGGSGSPASSRASASGGFSWPEAAGAAPGAEQAWPAEPEHAPGAAGSGADAGRESGAGEAERPQAITARDPRQQPVHPWQKSTRPEMTN